MKFKNVIPYFFASYFYSSKYAHLIFKGYNTEIKTLLNNQDFFYGEISYIYYCAMEHKNKEIIDFLEKKFNKVKFHQKENLCKAIEINNTTLIKKYLLNEKPDKNIKFLFTLLELANLYGKLEIIELLLDYGVDFKKKDYTCIRKMLNSGNFELFKLYHKYGLDINKNEYIFYSILNDNTDWYHYLINNGFVINKSNEKIIKSFISFKPSLNILESVKEEFIDEKELLKKITLHNPLAIKWFKNYYKKIDFYNNLNEILLIKNQKNKKIKTNKI